MFSYLAKQQLDDLDLETFNDGNAIHLRRKSTQEGFSLVEEKRLFMDLYKKHFIEIRAQHQHDGFWGTGLRNDDGRFDPTLPQGLEDYDYNARVGNEDPKIDTWPRMYSEEWLRKG